MNHSIDFRSRCSLLKWVALVALVSIPLLADDAAIVSKPASKPASATPLQALNAENQQLKPAESLLQQKPRLRKAGFLHDFWKSKPKAKVFSLKQPANPREDEANLVVAAGSNHPKGVVLFSIGF